MKKAIRPDQIWYFDIYLLEPIYKMADYQWTGLKAQ